MKIYSTMAIVIALAISSHAELVGSMHLVQNTTGDNQASYNDLATRTTGGAEGTAGVVGGTVDVNTSAVIASGVHDGTDVKSYSSDTQFIDVTRYGNTDPDDADKDIAVLVYDYDLSTYLTSHAAGTGAGQFTYTLDIGIGNRRTSGDIGDVEFYLSYSDGASQTMDATDIAGIATASVKVTVLPLLADTTQYTFIGQNPGGTGSATYSWDITSLIAASSDGKVRVAVLDKSDYRGDIQFLNATGIVSTEVIPEPASASLVLVSAGVAILLFRRQFI